MVCAQGELQDVQSDVRALALALSAPGDGGDDQALLAQAATQAGLEGIDDPADAGPGVLETKRQAASQDNKAPRGARALQSHHAVLDSRLAKLENELQLFFPGS